MYAYVCTKYLGTLATFKLITTKSRTFIFDITLQPIHYMKTGLHRTLQRSLKKRSMNPDFFVTFSLSMNIQLKLGSEFGSVKGVPHHTSVKVFLLPQLSSMKKAKPKRG